VHDLAAAGGVAHVDRALEVEVGDHGRQVIGVVVHVVPVPDLRRAAMAARSCANDAKALAEKEHHLGIPVIRTQRPAVREHDGGCVGGAPVLVEDLDTVFRGHVALVHD
jgi:hypothetical protein